MAAALALAALALIVASRAAQAANPVAVTAICSDGESGLQSALDQAVSGTPLVITMDQANCQINVEEGLTIGAGVDVTINGNGLVLDGGGTD